jgi:hypothetical protein
MSIKFGDLVKVITVNSKHEGRTGKVINVYEDEQTCLVQFGDSHSSGFFVRELEILPPAGTEEVKVRLAAEEDYTVTLHLTPEEKRGVQKLVKASQELMAEGMHPFAPDIQIRTEN